jgi:hypothetical protein
MPLAPRNVELVKHAKLEKINIYQFCSLHAFSYLCSKLSNIAIDYTNYKQNTTQFNIVKFVREVEKGQPEAFMTRLQAMMADTDYRIVGDSELYFQNFLFVFFRLLGFYVDVERATSDGRMDMIVKTPDYIYILEFKLNQTADAALQQIEEKGYAQPFAVDTRTLYKIIIN